ncbi:MAG TPA: alpha/beta fold hydrolase, partial [Acidimicrobiia bacterium]|nr:alpha/beta fold hydrolase [Acidimicrobiia bacterium]
MVSRAGKFFAAGGALAGMAAVAAVAASPVARDEVRWMARLARPLGPRTPGAPLPPVLPPGRVVDLPGRGEVFVRDSGETDLPPVLLLHGWTVSADLNFFTVYAELAGHYRILALDHRGHGRGMR